MENTTVLDGADYGGVTKEIRLTNESIGHLKETAKWGTFLAILGFVGIGFMILGGIAMFAFMSSMEIPGMEVFGGASFLGLVYIFAAAIYVYPVIKLFQFSKICKNAIAHSSTELMTDALNNLRACYKYIGIFMAFLIGFYVLGFLFGGIAAFFVAS